MPPELVQIDAVPVLEVGTYELSTGTRTFAEEDLQAAVRAFEQDAAVKAPRVKIDGLADSFAPGAHGGEPAFGWVDNLKVVEAGQQVVGDFHIPAWLEPMVEWAYPNRSIEGTPPGWESATGQAHELVITAVALLGVDLPGVSTLDDLSELLANGPPVAAPEEGAVLAAGRPSRVIAGLDQDLVARRFYDWIESGEADLPEGTVAWDLWIRSMRFGDDGTPYLKVTDESSGTLYRVDFTVASSEVTFSGFTEIVEQDVPVAAGARRRVSTVASWATRNASRATAQSEEPPMTDEQRRNFARSLGLAEDATEDQIHEAAASAETPPPEGEPTPPETPPEGEPAPEGEPPNAEERVEEPVAASALPAGVVAIDAAELARLRAGAETAQTLATRQSEEDRDRVLAQAMQDGRFPPARREHWQEAWASDPEGTRTLLTADEGSGGLARGLVPVSARGIEPQAESAQSEQADHAAYMERHFPGTIAARERRGVRHRQEV